MPNIKGLVNDPAFQNFAPAQQRDALFKLTNDRSFSGLSDADTQHFVTQLRTPAVHPQRVDTSAANDPGSFFDDSHLGGKAIGAIHDYAVAPFQKMSAKGGEVGAGSFEQGLYIEPYSTSPNMESMGVLTGQKPDPREVGVARGVGATVGSTVADPRNWPLAATGGLPSLAKTAMSAGFAAQMGKEAYDTAGELGSRMDSQSQAENWEQGTQLTGQIGMAGQAGAHAILGGGAAYTERVQMKAEQARQAAAQAAAQAQPATPTPAAPARNFYSGGSSTAGTTPVGRSIVRGQKTTVADPQASAFSALQEGEKSVATSAATTGTKPTDPMAFSWQAGRNSVDTTATEATRATKPVSEAPTPTPTMPERIKATEAYDRQGNTITTTSTPPAVPKAQETASPAFHWTDMESFQRILDSQTLEAGSATTDPNYVFAKDNTPHVGFALKEGSKYPARQTPTVPWQESEVLFPKDIDIHDTSKVDHLVVRNTGDAKAVRGILEEHYGDPNFFEVKVMPVNKAKATYNLPPSNTKMKDALASGVVPGNTDTDVTALKAKYGIKDVPSEKVGESVTPLTEQRYRGVWKSPRKGDDPGGIDHVETVRASSPEEAAEKLSKIHRSSGVPEVSLLPKNLQDRPSGVQSPAASPTPSIAQKAISTQNSKWIDRTIEYLGKNNTLTPKTVSMLERITGRKDFGGMSAPQVKQELTNFQTKQELLSKGNEHAEPIRLIEQAVEQRFKGVKPDNATSAGMAAEKGRALEVYRKAVNAGDSNGLMSALDVAKRWQERGAVGGNTRRFSDEELREISKAHLREVADTYEEMSGKQLENASAFEKLTSTQIDKQIALSGDVGLADRIDALRKKAATGGPGVSGGIMARLRSFVGPETLSPRDLVAGDMREAFNAIDRHKEMLNSKLEAQVKEADSWSIERSLKAFDDAENGRLRNSTNPAEQAIQTTQDYIAHLRDRIKDLGTGKFEHFIENYVPHLWANTGRFKAWISNVGELRGSGFSGSNTFLKPRYYDTVLEGVEAGLEPLTYNPITANLLRAHEMERYLLAHQVKAREIERGFMKFVAYGKEHTAPEGWSEVKGDIFRTMQQHADGERVQTGRYYAPDDVAKLFHNLMSPGLRGNLVYDVIRKYNNVVNQVNLGLSAFHATETVFNGTISETARSLQNVFKGNFLEAGSALAHAPSAGYHYYKLGQAGMAEYLDPGKYLELSDVINNLSKSGVRVGQPAEYRNQAMLKLGTALKQVKFAEGLSKVDPAVRAGFAGAGAVMEKASNWLMQDMVPKIKLGAAMAAAQDVMARMPDASPDMLRHEINKAVDSMDNRFGQVVYQNYFWNPIAKDLAMLGFRSVGWNWGTFREIGGGVKDAAQIGAKVISGNAKNIDSVSPRLAYTMVLPVVVGAVNSMVQYARTGKLPSETDTPFTDLVYPRDGSTGIDGKPNRSYIKSYLHDTISFFRDPLTTIENKAAPWLHQGFDVLVKNGDYYNTEIRHKDDPLYMQAMEVAQYFAKSSMPITFQNTKENLRQGKSLLQSVQAGMGILPAPRWVGQSPAEQFFYDQAVKQMPGGEKTKENFDRAQQRLTLSAQFENKQITAEDIIKLQRAGKLAPKDTDFILGNKHLPALERHAMRVDAPAMLEGWDKSTPQEQTRLLGFMYKKMNEIPRTYPSDRAQELLTGFRQRLATYRAGQRKTTVETPGVPASN